MRRRTFLKAMGGACAPAFLLGRARAAAAERPNILVILADDLGYGEAGCYGASIFKTPNIDKLARQSVRFTDAHCSSATCTPTRYSLLTGEYAWRKKGTGVLPGDAALIIDTARATLPSVLKSAGYRTGCVGKWHLGLGSGNIDWNGPIAPGPREVGFDYSFIMPATGDRVPCVYVENGRVANLDPNDPIQVNYQHKIGDWPTGRENPELLRMKLSAGHDMTIVNGVSRIGWMSGGKSALWKDETMAQTYVEKALSFVERQSKDPFFLYFATHDIHVPRLPNERWRGKAVCGLRCDAIQQLDWCVGELMGTLDRMKIAGDTLVIFTSDNGPIVDDGYADGSVEALDGHKPAGPLRGGKYSIYEGGTRVPFLTRWPKRVKPGASAALVSQLDFTASFASLTGQHLPQEGAPDSLDMLPALLGQTSKGRDALAEHAGNRVALRQGPWKYVPPPREAELYQLDDDIAETKNLAAARPEIAERMAAALEQLRAAGRSRA
jgi:arylsulfatase A-like enzyme